MLFLDELILWLATHAADLGFLNKEGPKVSKLVEAETAGRPIPIVSFVARQRDLRELVGEQVTGALQLGFADVLQWWEARFEPITLEDRNLPEIAARRLLRPRNQAAHQQVDRAYAETEKVRREAAAVGPRARGRGAEEPDRDAACGAEPRVDPDADRGTRRPGGIAALPRLGRRDRGGADR